MNNVKQTRLIIRTIGALITWVFCITVLIVPQNGALGNDLFSALFISIFFLPVYLVSGKFLCILLRKIKWSEIISFE